MGMSCYDGKDSPDGRCRNLVLTKKHLSTYGHFLELCELYLQSASPFEAQSDDAPFEAQSGYAPSEAQSGVAPPEAPLGVAPPEDPSDAAPPEDPSDAAPPKASSDAPCMTPMIMTPPPHGPPTPPTTGPSTPGISHAMERVTVSSGYDVKLQEWKALHCNPSYSPAKMHLP